MSSYNDTSTMRQLDAAVIREQAARIHTLEAALHQVREQAAVAVGKPDLHFITLTEVIVIVDSVLGGAHGA